jgi:hypothetical protein
MKLYNMVKAKTGYISDKLFKEAQEVAKHKEKPEDFDTWSKDKQLEYISNVMAVWIINNKGEKKNG